MRSWAPMIESNFTSQSISLHRPLRRLLAILFAAATTTYSVLWIKHVRQPPRQPGFVSYEYSPATRSMVIGGVVPGSPAHKAGLRTGDRVVAIDGQPLESLRPFYEAIVIGQKDVVDVTAERPGAPGGRQTLELVLRGGKPAPRRMSSLEDLLSLPVAYYPLGFLIVGLAVLFLRLDDPHAWLLAVLFGSFLAGGPLFEGAIPPHAEEYGGARLVDILQKNRVLPVNAIVAAIQASVQEFSGATQPDDITLILARCR